MPNASVQFNPDSTGVKLRTYRRGALTSDEADWYRVFTSGRVTSGVFAVSTFRTIGAGSDTANLLTAPLFAIGVDAESTVAVAVRSLSLITDVTVRQDKDKSMMGLFKTYRTTGLPGAGTQINPTPFDSTRPSAEYVVWPEGHTTPGVEIRGSCGIDGGALSTITATLDHRIWQQFSHRFQSSIIGHSRGFDNSLIPALSDDAPILLLPGEGLVVQYEGQGRGWRNTSHGIVKAVYEEFTKP